MKMERIPQKTMATGKGGHKDGGGTGKIVTFLENPQEVHSKRIWTVYC